MQSILVSYRRSPSKTCHRYGLSHSISSHCPVSGVQYGKYDHPNHWQQMCDTRTPPWSSPRKAETGHLGTHVGPGPDAQEAETNIKARKGQKKIIIRISQNHKISKVYPKSNLFQRPQPRLRSLFVHTFCEIQWKDSLKTAQNRNWSCIQTVTDTAMQRS